MLISPKILAQQNNINKNKKTKVKLAYSDEFIFYKILDQNIENGKTVIITFKNDKITKECDLFKRISCCANGKEFFEQMVDLAKTAIDAYKYFAKMDVFELWKVTSALTQRVIYQSYKVEYAYADDEGGYFIFLEPIGEGSSNKDWMFRA